ncbi:hypothetical protein CVT25_015459 [Psilocybe cyanescens]|uniref:Uncharacterized protein n=1 Tax=Psilocybe cyanescens TaxID=93625 RepID=A0A409X1N2_PSICY|nr:hypothetical protein CVT25_015459 [Psilocybe cyanescens]
MTLAEPVRSSRRSTQARPPIQAQQDKGKGWADKPAPTPALSQPHPPAKKPVVPNQRPPPQCLPPPLTMCVWPHAACKKASVQQPAELAAPPSRPASCKGRRILEYTLHDPFRCQLLINVGDHPKDANLATLFKDLSSDVLSCQSLCIKVLGV